MLPKSKWTRTKILSDFVHYKKKPHITFLVKGTPESAIGNHGMENCEVLKKAPWSSYL